MMVRINVGSNLKKIILMVGSLFAYLCFYGQTLEEIQLVYLGLSDPVHVDEMPYHFKTRVNMLDHFFDRFNMRQNIRSRDITDVLLLKFGVQSYPKGEPWDEVRKMMIYSLIDSAYLAKNIDECERMVDDMVYDEIAVEYDVSNWFAYTQINVVYRGKKEVAKLLMRIVQNKPEIFEWKIVEVSAPFLKVKMDKSVGFIQPNAHENGFLGLRHALDINANVSAYFVDDMKYTSTHQFISNINNGLIEYQEVKSVSYWFYPDESHYFSVRYHNRKSTNSGWLISEVVNFKDTCPPLYRAREDLLFNNHRN